MKEQRSLFGEILDWMLAPLLLLWPMSVVLTWLVAQGISNKPFDRQLGEMAHALSRQISLQTWNGNEQHAFFHLQHGVPDLLHADEEDAVHYQVLGPQGELLSGELGLPLPVDDERNTHGVVTYRDAQINQETVRVAHLWISLPGAPANMPALVQVAETVNKRSRLATEIIKGVMLPQFVILPLAVLLVWLALARGIMPLNDLQQRIRRRESHDLSPLNERDVPEEVSPLVEAINDLLTRLGRSISVQKQFLADAAHQLKTPLAGLRTQAELAQREIDAGERDPQALKKSLQQIALSSQRATRMVNQLLSMARAEDVSQALSYQRLNLTRIATEAVQDFVPRALEKRIDLGFEGPGAHPRNPHGLSLRGQPVLLRELVRNLVDNALHYTPEGGVVTVRVVDDPFGQVVVLQIEDSGPGIPAPERDKVFQPFYRALGTNVDGSGLGLAIVKEIAQQHRAELTLEEANLRYRPPRGEAAASPSTPYGPGARFTLRFPAVASNPPASNDPADGFRVTHPGSL